MEKNNVPYIKIIAVGLLFLLTYVGNAQGNKPEMIEPDREEGNKLSKHSIVTEIGGRTFILGSLNYEYAIHKRISLGGGTGLIGIQRGGITRDNNGAPEDGKYFDASSTQMIYGNYFIGKDKHKLFFTVGATNFLFTYRNKYPSGTELSRELQLEWNAGIGYQFSHKRLYYRLTGYCISMPEPSAWFPKYMPWAGLSIAYKL